jgi:D-alanyl-D-alanine carboxypeptidase/D-alanyl-D-alanine-endopeptidase (penicillin-binding protein 4)
MRNAIALCSIFVGGLAAATELPAPIQRILDGHALPAEDLSIFVQQVGASEPLLSHFAQTPRNPASTIKLLTTWVALDTLGPTYSWPTEVYFLGEWDGTALQGDLGFKGYGDPFLVTEEFWKLLRALRRTGLEEVDGDLVIDDTFFAPVTEDPGTFDGQPLRTYNVTPNAFLVNFKTVRFQFLADSTRGEVRIDMDPELSNLEIRNRLELAPGACSVYQAGISFGVDDYPAGREVVLDGRFPAACSPYSLSRTVLEHDSFAYGVYRALWAELGGRHRGGVRRGVVPADAEPALTWTSQPLAEVIRSLNKYSNNVMTRQLLYTLGAEFGGAPGTQESGNAAIVDYLESHGLRTEGLVIDNGAGLSRATRISAELIGRVLLIAAASPLAPEFLSSLSLGGLDGTTRGRFRGHPEAGRMHLKTGRLDDVAAVAGYVHARDGLDYVTVVVLNTKDAHRGPGEELQEALLHWVHARP